MTIIDTHVHLGNGVHLQLSTDGLLALMDEAEVAVAATCAVDRYLAVDNVEGNKLLIEAVSAHPDRLMGMASANPWLGSRAVTEVRRALDAGLHGVMAHPLYQGFRLSDPIIDPLLELAREFDVPFYAPTGIPGIAEPFHLAELARRFPDVRFIMGHGGASDYYYDTVRATQMIGNVWIESSRNGPGNYQLFAAHGLLDRLVFGSGAPEFIPVVEAAVIRDTIPDENVLAGIFADNAAALFKGRLPDDRRIHSHIAAPLDGSPQVVSSYGKTIEGTEQYLATYRQNGVDACWVFGCSGWYDSSQIAAENTALSHLAAQYPAQLFPWGTVNPHWPEDGLRREIRRMATELKLWGIKLVPITQGGSLAGPGMDILADEAIKCNLPVFLHDGSPEYCSAIQVDYFARKYPQLRVVAAMPDCASCGAIMRCVPAIYPICGYA